MRSTRNNPSKSPLRSLPYFHKKQQQQRSGTSNTGFTKAGHHRSLSPHKHNSTSNMKGKHKGFRSNTHSPHPASRDRTQNSITSYWKKDKDQHEDDDRKLSPTVRAPGQLKSPPSILDQAKSHIQSIVEQKPNSPLSVKTPEHNPLSKGTPTNEEQSITSLQSLADDDSMLDTMEKETRHSGPHQNQEDIKKSDSQALDKQKAQKTAEANSKLEDIKQGQK